MCAFILVVLLGLICSTTESSDLLLDQPQLYMPSEALVGDVVDFQCEIPNPHNQSISLKLFKHGDREEVLGYYTLPTGEAVGVFPKVIRLSLMGHLECVASLQNNTDVEPTVSRPQYLRVIEKVKGAQIVYSGPAEVFEGSTLKLNCQVQTGNFLSYEWFVDGKLISSSPHHYIADGNLLITRVTSEHGGSYRCEASNTFNRTKFLSSSMELLITVKDPVSAPDVSFEVLKEQQNYSAMVTCRCMSGTLPIAFSLYDKTGPISNVTVSERHAMFKVPVVLDQNSKQVQCQAHNGDRAEASGWRDLSIVSVGAPVTIHSNYDLAENYAVVGLRLSCKATKGSHPRFQWYHNRSALQGRGAFYAVYNQYVDESILLLSVGADSAGSYRCDVWDSFDNSTAISSKRLYVDREELNRLPLSVVVVVFGCFAVLVLLVSFCCLFGSMFRQQQQFQEKPLLSLEMEDGAVSYEIEDLRIYADDTDGLKTPREHQFYQESLSSEDEWEQIEPKTTTLEDEAAV